VSRSIDGNPSQIEEHSDYYLLISTKVRETVENLASVGSIVDTVSDAVDAFAETAAEVRTDLQEVDERYDALATQLRSYASALRGLQDREDAIVAQDEDAKRNHSWYSSQYDDAVATAQSMQHDDPGLDAQMDLVRQYSALVEQASDEIWAGTQKIDALRDEWREVADRHADAIQEVIRSSDLNDSWWDVLVDFVQNTLPKIEMWLDILAIVLTVVAFLAILTGVGAALAPALFAIARGIQLLSKIIKVAKIALTVAFVATGKMPPTALVDIAVDMALDKVGGKAVDGVSNRLTAKFGSEIANGLSKIATDKQAKLLIDNGFDSWVTQTTKELTDAMPTPTLDGVSDAITGGLDSVNSAVVDGVAVPGGGFMSDGTAFQMSLDMWAGEGNVVSDLAFDGIKFGLDRAEDAGIIEIPDVTSLSGMGQSK